MIEMELNRLAAIGCLGVWLGMAACGAAAEPLPNEAELLAVLRSDAAEADKAIACKDRLQAPRGEGLGRRRGRPCQAARQ
ncbi:MAG: hypothetical protein EBR28_12550 [Planctomycetia bacterium]|nr:hypothetical protein [Planctomycetia bacterium]